MSLDEEIVALVQSEPGLTTRQILIKIGRRRSVVLATLTELHRERILLRKSGRHGAGVWKPLDRFPGGQAHSREADVSEPGGGSHCARTLVEQVRREGYARHRFPGRRPHVGEASSAEPGLASDAVDEVVRSGDDREDES
jgi:hypothetical protein